MNNICYWNASKKCVWFWKNQICRFSPSNGEFLPFWFISPNLPVRTYNPPVLYKFSDVSYENSSFQKFCNTPTWFVFWLLGDLRVRIMQKIDLVALSWDHDIVAFWFLFLDVVALCLSKKCLGNSMCGFIDSVFVSEHWCRGFRSLESQCCSFLVL